MAPILGIIASQITGHLNNNSYESISTVTVGSGGSSSISFSSIPATYKHLQIRGIAKTTSGAAQLVMQVGNGSVDTGANYSWHELVGNGSAASSGAGTSDTSMRVALIDSNSNIFAALVIDILDYANTNKYKTSRNLAGLDTNGGGQIKFMSGSWRSTSSVNSITLSGTTFPQYTSFALYGIKG